MIMLSDKDTVNIKQILIYLYYYLLINKLIDMSINLPVLVAVAILVVILIVFQIVRNQKDKKKFEEEIIDTELPPEKDDKENL